MTYIYLLKKVNEIFGIAIYFLYLCNVIYSCSLFEDKNSYNSFNFIILIIRLKLLVCEKSVFYGMASELSHFLFMHYAVGFALRLFICEQERYLIEDDKLYI